jgi:4-amino-4-deoxy-L-arabinose transferase-like glycosyltransferase
VGLVAPLVIMSLAKDKSERYLLPMLAPAAVAAGHAVMAMVNPAVGKSPAWRMAWWLHWALLLTICVGVPAAGAIGAVLPARQAWWTPTFAAVAATVLVIAWAFALLMSIRRRPWIGAGTMLVMFAVHGVFLYGYRDSPPGRSELKPIADAILAARPSADVWFYDPSPVPKSPPQDLQIYLNRVVRQAGAPEQLPPGDVVIVSLQRGDVPIPAPPGWQSFTQRQVPGRQRFWHASSAVYNLRE